LLVRASQYAPLDDLAGDARAEAAAWAAVNLQGWPPRPYRDWPAQAWKGVTVESGTSGIYVATLTTAHAQSFTGDIALSHTRFDLTCEEGRLKIRREQFGYGDEPWQVELPGQRGDLNETLALALGKTIDNTVDSPWFAQAATGIEWESGRARELNYSGQGFVRHGVPRVPGGNGMRFLERSDGEAVGEWLRDGSPTGESIRFERLDGLWKVADHTQHGRWLSPPTSSTWMPPNLNDFSPAGVRVGIRDGAVVSLLGQPDETEQVDTGILWRYLKRGIEVYLNHAGRVQRVRVRSGSVSSGVAVGAPATLLEAMFGPSPDYTYRGIMLELLQFTVENGRVTAIAVFLP
jgi:hypothetical protein